MASSNKTIVVVGSGPGIGRSVTSLFASKRYNNVALIARRAEQLELERRALKGTVGPQVNVRTYAVDIADDEAFLKALQSVEAELGKPECVFFNAARVLPSHLLSHDVKDIEYDFKACNPCCDHEPDTAGKHQETLADSCIRQINVSALYTCAQRVIPQLIDLAKVDKAAMPALIVTSSMLPQHPIPQLFALSLAKAAQRNLMQSLAATYSNQGVHLGLINVSGQVSLTDDVLNPTNIAAKSWEWCVQSKDHPTFEVVI